MDVVRLPRVPVLVYEFDEVDTLVGVAPSPFQSIASEGLNGEPHGVSAGGLCPLCIASKHTCKTSFICFASSTVISFVTSELGPVIEIRTPVNPFGSL